MAESKIAPLLISGSWIGWLKHILQNQLGVRFKTTLLDPLSPEEGLDTVYNYGKLFDADLTEDSALAIQSASRNYPFYISSIIRSDSPGKKLSTSDGVDNVIRYELYNPSGEIHKQWMEYITYAFEQTNGSIGKAIVLFLSLNRHQEKTRPEIADYLKRKGIVDINDEALEKRLQLLEKSDIISEGINAFRFKGIPDDLFHEVFLFRYAEEIENQSREETIAAFQERNRKEKEKSKLQLFGQNKGYFLEFMMIYFLKHKATLPSTPPLQDLIENAPEKATFTRYETVSDYHFNLPEGHHRQFDVLAKASNEEKPSLLIECKYWEEPVGLKPVEEFARKSQEVSQKIPYLIPIIYSVSGFRNSAIEFMKNNNLAWSEEKLWAVLEK